MALVVPWPPVPATAAFRRTLKQLAATSALSWQESVSSDTSRSAPISVTLHDPGPRFLASEVYGDGSGLHPFQLPAPAGQIRFAFAVGGAIHVEMTTDQRGRLLAEQLTTPNHLIVRTFAP